MHKMSFYIHKQLVQQVKYPLEFFNHVNMQRLNNFPSSLPGLFCEIKMVGKREGEPQVFDTNSRIIFKQFFSDRWMITRLWGQKTYSSTYFMDLCCPHLVKKGDTKTLKIITHHWGHKHKHTHKDSMKHSFFNNKSTTQAITIILHQKK